MLSTWQLRISMIPLILTSSSKAGHQGETPCAVPRQSAGAGIPRCMKALWATYGKPAGHIRNDAMIYLGMNANCRLAFIDQCRQDECQGKTPHDTHGAGKCAERAQSAGIEVRRYGWRY